ncbi:MAG: transposase, partial [Pirellulales bacterium]|nr:transposase [Pirellulales bacterium]
MSDGCYLLRSNLTNLDAATLWKRYIQLTEAEWAFRITKDELEIRPIWHHQEDRVKAHILVCFLAYAMWKTLAGWMRAAGLGDAPRTLLYDLEKIKSADVVLPARTQDGCLKTVRLRCVTEPDEAQAALLDRLGLRLPRRLYVAIGVNFEGHKELLGLWLNETEGAKFWLACLTDLQNRGVRDIFIVSVDGLGG